MSKSNPIFNSIPVQIPDRSGFDLSHEVLTTAMTGTVVPVTYFEVLPGDTVSMGSMMKVTLPPFAVPFMGRIDAELTAAFIPYRLLWNGWQNFITQNNGSQKSGLGAGLGSSSISDTSVNPYGIPTQVPTFMIPARNNTNATRWDKFYGAGSLIDYLGLKTNSISSATAHPGRFNALPALAYQKFCDDWVRDENNMKPFFPRRAQAQYNFDGGSVNMQSNGVRVLPYFVPQSSTSTFDATSLSLEPGYLSDAEMAGVPFDGSIGLGSLRQRCWSKDYFTTATSRPQAGADAQVFFNVSGEADGGDNSVTASGTITVASIRAASALQRWLERNNIAGTDYGSQILAHFGVTPPDAVLDRSVLLGSVRTPVVVGSVENNSNADASSTRNPFGSALGSAAGFGSGFDRGSLVDEFSPKEHGVVMVFFTLIPHQYYNTGVKRSLLHLGVGDYAWPEFSGIGDQEIRSLELTASGSNTVFGYNQRYSEWKFELDRISGLLADGQSLDVYALQRGFLNAPELGKSFLEIPTNYLDQVFAVTTASSGYSCIVDAYFDARVLRVLPEYSLPHL